MDGYDELPGTSFDALKEDGVMRAAVFAKLAAGVFNLINSADRR
jgi:hypothetical protein